MDNISRRRRFESEDGDDNDFDYKRMRGVSGVDIGSKLIHMITKLDENINGTLEETLSQLAETLFENLEMYEGQIIEILCECAMFFPEKLTYYTTLIGLINVNSSSFGENMISKLIIYLNNSLVNEEYDIVLRLTTFLSDLGNVNVITTESIFDFLQTFINLANEENVRSDYFVYNVLHSLPWIGAELSDKKNDKLDQLLLKIENYISLRKKLQVNMLKVWTSQNPHPQEDYIDCLWTQIQKLKRDKWLEHHIVRTYTFFKTTFKDGVAHTLPNVDPNVIINNKNMPLPHVIFRLFDSSDCPDEDQTLAPATSIERFLIEEDLNWLIDNNYTDWRLCAKELFNYHRRQFIPLSYAIIEVIFGKLFCLPRPKHIEIFYSSLLLELCRIKPNSVPQVLAQAAELLYQRVDTMQPICLDRFVNWFSFHLSNFQYHWSWSDWSDCLQLDSLHPKLMFVREVIEKCMRFSYHKKLLDFLPKEFFIIAPADPILVDICEDADEETQLLAAQIQNLIEDKKPDEIFELLKKDPSSTECNPDSVAVFTSVLLRMASKTFSHSFTALTKYHKIFRTIVADNEEMQSVILRTLYNCWNRNKQMLTILVDKMLKMQIIDPAIVQAWVFCNEMKREFKKSWVWDVLNTAINRIELHYSKLAKNHKALVEKYEKMKAQNNGEENGNESVVRPKITAPEVEKQDDVEEMDFDKDLEKKFNVLSDLEEKIAESQTQLEEIEDNLRNILLNICHKFTLTLTEHLLNCETDEMDAETDFYNYVSGRFRHIFLTHLDSMWKFSKDLDSELFSSATIEPRILRIFNEFKALKT